MKAAHVTRFALAVAVIMGVITVGATVLNIRAVKKDAAVTANRAASLVEVNAVRDSSQLLTNTVRAYVVTREKRWLDAYWAEVESGHQAQAIKKLKALGTPAAELDLLAQASSFSAELVTLETRALGLVLATQPQIPTPSGMANFRLTPQDAQLPEDQKRELARSLVYNDVYFGNVEKIIGKWQQFHDSIINRLDAEQKQAATSRDMSGKVLIEGYSKVLF